MKGRTKICLALVAGAMAVTAGGAVAATSGGGGVIQACASKQNGALRLLTGRKCPHGYRAISWNRQGLPGAPGAPGANGQNGQNGINGADGATNVTVRSVTGAINESCTPAVALPGFYNCATTSTLSASCNPGEKATGGGFTSPPSAPTDPVAVTESRPNVTTGTPTGWSVTATAGSTFTPAPTGGSVQIPLYVICVSS